MKDKRVIALFITSIFAFVLSVSISVGVAVAFADPVIATGLSELKFNISNPTEQSIVFDPVAEFNDNIKDAINCASYDKIYYSNEAIVDTIRLAKVTVNNPTEGVVRYRFKVDVAGDVNAKKYVRIAIFSLDSEEITRFAGNDISAEFSIEAGKSSRFVLAGYVRTNLAKEVVDFSEPMDMTINLDVLNA